MSNTEPLIHSHITDVLPPLHPLANEHVTCVECGVLVHADNNECMQTWVEWEDDAFCGMCFAQALIVSDGVLK